MPLRFPFRAVAVATAAVLLAVPAAAATSDWANGTRAKARLHAVGVGDDGRLSGAIEIILPPGWKTYWRHPGDAGLAPVIDLSASRNLGKPDVSFPLPTREKEGTLFTNVYYGRVVLPFSALATDPKSAVDLVVSLDLGVCQTVCIPDRIVARLLVPAGRTDAVAAKTIADARALVPGPAQPGVLAVDGVKRTGGTDKRPVFQVAVSAPDAGKATVFVEGPADWYSDTPVLAGASGTTATFEVKMDRLTAKTPLEGAAFRVTIAAGGKAVEQVVPVQ